MVKVLIILLVATMRVGEWSPIAPTNSIGYTIIMNKITIAFDVDGTLIKDSYNGKGSPVANERIRSLLVALASFKNVRIVVWSGGGEIYARQVAREIGIAKYVDEYASKNLQGKNADGSYLFTPDIKPDIAIDDIQACDLGVLNLIVREK